MRMSAALSGALEHELKGLNEEIARVGLAAQAKQEAAEKLVAEIREAGINPLLDDDASSKVDAAYMEADNLKTRLTVLNQRRDRTMGNYAEAAPLKTSGQVARFIETITGADGFAEYAQQALGGGRLPSFSVEGVVDRDSLLAHLRAGAPGGIFAAGADGAGLIPIDQRLTPPVGIPRRKVRLLDLITIDGTDSNVVEYGKQTVQTSAAASKAVPTAGTGVAYDQATYTWSNQSVNVRDIGHYAKAPRANLSDQSALQGLIEGELSSDVLLKAESLAYSGGGTGVDFQGIETAVNADSKFITRDTTNERRLIALHRAVTAVRLSLYDEPNGVTIHPTDLHEMISEESTSGGFLMAATSLAAEQPSVWGLNVVATALTTLNEPIVGDFKRGATLWVREGISVRISDSNEDDFIKRMITVLAEFRGAFAVKRTYAFCGVKEF
jgi:HK97 family phage major capsid protein